MGKRSEDADDVKTIPSGISLNYDRPINFQFVPELLVDVESPEGHDISRRWVVVGRADVIDEIIRRGGKTIVISNQLWRGPYTRGHGRENEVTLSEIIAERYVSHGAHGRTRYVAATVIKNKQDFTRRRPSRGHHRGGNRSDAH